MDFVTVDELAAEWRVSRMTVYRLVHAGTLPSVRVGRQFRIARADADAYLRASR